MNQMQTKKNDSHRFAVSARRTLMQSARGCGFSDAEAQEIAFGWFFRLTALRFLSVNFPEEWGGTAETPAAACERLRSQFPAAFPEEHFAQYACCLPDALVPLLRESVPDAAFLSNVQQIGWLYQHSNSEDKAQLPAQSKRNTKVSAAQLHAATQLFTPEWLVRYLTENTLGCYCRDKAGLSYFLSGGQDAAVRCNPEQLRVLDPCMGSGNMLVAAFDLLLQIYQEHGIAPAEAAVKIPQQNLYGLDIDPHACRLTAFALMMKTKAVCPAADFAAMRLHLAHFRFSPAEGVLCHADQLGSLLTLTPDELPANAPAAAKDAAALLSQQYDVICTNPPYMSNSSMNPILSGFLRQHYEDYKADLFSAFMVRCAALAKPDGRLGFLTPYVWMFIRSYEKLRERIYRTQTIETLVQFAYSAFRDATVPVCAFTLRNRQTGGKGIYIRLSEFSSSTEIQREKLCEAARQPACGWRYTADPAQYSVIPGKPVAYWLPEALRHAFAAGSPLGTLADARQGLATGCNSRFLRYWFEVPAAAVCRTARNRADAKRSGKKWFPYNKGGDYRKWYGNDLYVVNWADDGAEIRSFRSSTGRLRSRPQNMQYYFRACFSWSLVSSSDAAFRYKPAGQIFDVSGMSCFCEEHAAYLLALCNSKPAKELLKAIAPTINYQCGDIAALPVLPPEDAKQEAEIEALVRENIALCKEDWDSFELSADFQRHCLMPPLKPES